MQRRPPTSQDEEIAIHTNPTHLDRVAGWIVLAVWVWCAVMAGFVEIWSHVPIEILLTPLLVIVFITVTAEVAVDIEVVGVLSTFLRARMGQRSAFEWADARLHYLRLVEVPAGRATCERYSKLFRQRTRSWRTIKHKLIKR